MPKTKTKPKLATKPAVPDWRELGIETLELELTDFKRFGEAAAERWGKAEEQFWAWWKDGGEAEFRAEQSPTVAVDAEPTEEAEQER